MNQKLRIINTPPAINGVAGVPTENIVTKAIGETLKIIVKPKENFKGVVKVDGVVVAEGEVNQRLQYKYNVTGYSTIGPAIEAAYIPEFIVPETLVGVFLDSEVEGACYETSSGITGKTNEKGEYSYKEGDTIQFCVGDVMLGPAIEAKFLTTVFDLESPEKVALFLQSIDSDGNPENGIKITEEDYQKFENTDFLISEVSDTDESFREKFNLLYGFDPVNAFSSSIDHAALSYKRNLLKRFGGDFFNYMTKTLSFKGVRGADSEGITVYKESPNARLNTNENARFRLYAYDKFTIKEINLDISAINNAINSNEETMKDIEEKSKKFVDLVVSTAGLVGQLKGGVNDIKALRKIDSDGGSLIKFGLTKGIEKTSQEIQNGSLSMMENWLKNIDPETESIFKVLKDCLPNYKLDGVKFSYADYIKCTARVSGELGIKISRGYGHFNALALQREKTAISLTRDYLKIYYLFNRNQLTLRRVFDELANRVNENTLSEEFSLSEEEGFNYNDLDQLNYVFDLLTKREFGHISIEGIKEYDFDEVKGEKGYIKKYQHSIEQYIKIFNELDSDLYLAIDNDYLSIKLSIEPTFGINKYNICTNIKNNSAFSVDNVYGYLTIFFDYNLVKERKFFDGAKNIAPDDSIKLCEILDISLDEILLSPGVISVEYDVRYNPRRRHTDQRSQVGSQFFEISEKTLLNDLAVPIVTLDKPVFVFEGNDFEIVANTISIIPEDFFIYNWEVISSESIDIIKKENNTITYQAPYLSEDKYLLPIKLKLVVTSATNFETTEKEFLIFVRQDTTPPVITINGATEVTITKGDNYTDEGATAIDNVDDFVLVYPEYEYNTNAVGTYIITYTATDSAGNVATAQRTLYVIDSLQPNLNTFPMGTSPKTVNSGENIGLTSPVVNQGNTQSSSSILKYYITTIEGDFNSGTQLSACGNQNIPALDSSGSEIARCQLKPPATSGTYYYYACVDAVNNESNLDDNCSSTMGSVVVSEVIDPISCSAGQKQVNGLCVTKTCQLDNYHCPPLTPQTFTHEQVGATQETATTVPYLNQIFNAEFKGAAGELGDHWWKLDLTANEDFTIAFTGHLDASRIALDLYDANENKVVDMDYIYDGDIKLINHHIGETGSYYLKVSGLAIGNYDLAVYSAWSNAGITDNDRDFYYSFKTARYLSNGYYPRSQLLSDKSRSTHLSDYYRFTAEAGAIFSVDLTARLNSGRVALTLYDTHEQKIKSIDYIYDGDTETLSHSIPVDGVYYLKVWGANGAYDFTVSP